MNGVYFIIIFLTIVILIYFYFKRVAISEKAVNDYIKENGYFYRANCILSYLYAPDSDNESFYHFKMILYAYDKGLLFIRDSKEILGPYSMYFTKDLSDFDNLKMIDEFLLVSDIRYLHNSVDIFAKSHNRFLNISQSQTYNLQLINPSLDFDKLMRFLKR